MNKKSLILSVLIVFGTIVPSNATPTPADPKVVHILNRLSFGIRPGDIEKVNSMGVESYIKQQLSPNSISEPQSLTSKINKLETLNLSVVELTRKYGKTKIPGQKLTQEQIQDAKKQMRKLPVEATNARLLLAVESPRQLQEVMVDFWFNHFNVFAGKDRIQFWVSAYERGAIRPHTLGKFRDLLEATARHPAMLYYLDNWQNTAPNSPGMRHRTRGLNENYARELMELHTLGVDSGYTQQDVTTLARILTGWGFDLKQNQNNSGFFFDSNRHDFSDKIFLGQAIKGTGEAEVEQALDILAKHPATARHISYKLAQYFVRDNPPETLVKKMQQRFIATDGDIREVLTTLFQSSEFWDAENYNAKFKTPYQYVISAVRATGMEVNNVQPLVNTLKQLGMPLFGCPTPNGYENTEQAWLNPDGLNKRLTFAVALANGRLLGQKNEKKASSITRIDASQLSNSLGNNFSSKTQNAINSSSPQLRAALILGSPEFMRK
ncbi:DUF1800 domain-containing protein [Synechocystis sp. PCC 7509]|uniref:DUF1800 domain-containing protein n=1 Tax=Synechocystis sp. PCC 7509 TaxID=927677 RepID=UPI0002AC9113|nr:DUF1800 domain-containing protein [Synechocystis sp. PCC 7509]